jgi:2-C-methyl-D-erythritol 4-phosphate cytidylyltransferase
VNAAIVVAGGEGERSGRPGGKQLAQLRGKPVLAHALLAFEACPEIGEIVLVAHPDRTREYLESAVLDPGITKVTAVVAGGARRQDSVAAGIRALSAEAELVAIHDGARPLVTPGLIAAALVALAADPEADGVVIGHPSYDTVKTVDAGRWVTGTPDRSSVWMAQTPQVFRRAALERAYRDADDAGLLGTDDASLVEAAGGSVRMLAGPRDNIKITVPEDLTLAEALLAAREET